MSLRPRRRSSRPSAAAPGCRHRAWWTIGPRTRWRAPLVWTTLRLTSHADGRADVSMPGASRFPRHWIYGPDGELARKSALTAFNAWYRRAHGEHTPWGNEDSPALVVDVETEVERSLSTAILRSGARPAVRSIEPGTLLIEQGGAAGPPLRDPRRGSVGRDRRRPRSASSVLVPSSASGPTSRTRPAQRRCGPLTQVRIAEAAFDDVDSAMLAAPQPRPPSRRTLSSVASCLGDVFDRPEDRHVAPNRITERFRKVRS